MSHLAAHFQHLVTLARVCFVGRPLHGLSDGPGLCRTESLDVVPRSLPRALNSDQGSSVSVLFLIRHKSLLLQMDCPPRVGKRRSQLDMNQVVFDSSLGCAVQTRSCDHCFHRKIKVGRLLPF
jgi:hypothetical protein